jgi:GDP-L-fucose synthase
MADTINKNSHIYVAGHRGLVGSALLRCFRADGYVNLITHDHASLDLTNADQVESFFNGWGG